MNFKKNEMRKTSTRSTQGWRIQHAKSVELKVSLQQEWEQMRVAFFIFPIRKKRKKERKKKRLQRKKTQSHVTAHCPRRQHYRKQLQVNS